MGQGDLLIANRGEIAIRIARAAAELDLRSVAVYGEDDVASLHVRAADDAHPLRGTGPVPYLDAEQLVTAALASGCHLVHPGYGFLSEDPAFARRCAEAGLTFVGPSPENLERFGDKASARALAARCGVPVLAGTAGATSSSFWWRRCTLHSRSPRWLTAPVRSPRIWISTWRAGASSCSTNTSSRPNAWRASDRQRS